MLPIWVTIVVFLVTLIGAPFFWGWVSKVTGFDQI